MPECETSGFGGSFYFYLSGNDDRFEIQWDSDDGQRSRFFYFAEKIERRRLVLGNNKN